MSALKSWFQSTASLSSSPSWLPPGTELVSSRGASPRSRASASASVSPSPAVTPSKSPSARRSSGSNRRGFLELERNEASIRRQIQHLLDAQGDAIVAGSGTEADNAPASPSGIDGKVIPVRQPPKQTMSLAAARRGLHYAMLDLAKIKSEELETVDKELGVKNEDMLQFEDWRVRRTRLEEEIDSIQQNQNAEELASLATRNSTLQDDINTLEEQLARLKDEQARVQRDITRITNTVDSRLSSYRRSLAMLDQQTTAWLKLHANGTLGRRNIAVAEQDTQSEINALEARRQAAADESEAVDAGLTIWTDAVQVIEVFEADMQRGMQALGGHGQDDAAQTLHQLLAQMDSVIADLNDKARLAETRRWRLLVCCIGAELEAFRQGRQILAGALAAGGAGADSLAGAEGEQSSSRAGGHYSSDSEHVGGAHTRAAASASGSASASTPPPPPLATSHTSSRASRDASRGSLGDSGSSTLRRAGKGVLRARFDDEPDVDLLVSRDADTD